jgi:hypothetical protein
MGAALQVKGFAWLNLLQFVKERHGADTFAALVAAFPAERAQFDTAAVLPIGWVSGALHLAAVSWVVTQKYGGTSEGAQRFGSELAARNVSSTFTSFARLEDLKVALTTTERAFGQFYSRGHMKLTLNGDLLDAELSDFPDANPVFGNVLGAGLVSFLRGGNVDATLRSVSVEGSTIRYQVQVVLPSTSRLTPLPMKP